MEPVSTFNARAVPMPADNIDTDRIIPARFLKVTTRGGLGAHLFADVRFDAQGLPKPDFPLNDPLYAGASILVAGNNFGCGSSREHAPWALCDYGFKAIVSSAFADIFHNNSLKNGLLPIRVTEGELLAIFSVIKHDPQTEFTVDLDTQELRWPGGTARFPIAPFAKMCLRQGVDELGYIMAMESAIAAYERVAGQGTTA